MYTNRAYALTDIPLLAGELKTLLNHYAIITFSGSLGAGKTTLIQELLRQCGVQERVTSPTFAYMNHYVMPGGKVLYHADLYRMKTKEDFYALGFDEYLEAPDTYMLIEWPEHIMSLLPEQVCHVRLEYHPNMMQRIITIECPTR